MSTTNFTVTSENGSSATDLSGLSNVISSISVGGANAAAGTAYTVTLGGNIDLSAHLANIHLAAGSSLTINGDGYAIDGEGQYHALFVYDGTVSINNLTIQNSLSHGGNATADGGGGAGLGGGLFVAGTSGGNTGGHVALDNVSFLDDSAVGGNGSEHSFEDTGGGGGGLGGYTGGGLGNFGQGGGYQEEFFGPVGEPGGFGGGGGGGKGQNGYGGFGGGGGSRPTAPMGGGFGGGGGGVTIGAPNGTGGVGGGGLGAGGDVFVQQGGSLTIEGGSLSGGSVAGGTTVPYAQNGAGIGSGIFLEGNQAVTFAPTAGQVVTIDDVIADDGGSHVNIDGANGTVVFDAANTYSGTTTIESGALTLGTAGSISSSSLVVDSGATFDMSAAAGNQTVASLSGTGTVLLGANSLTVGGSGDFAGTIAGTGAVSDAGNATLSGTADYTGATTIDSGAQLTVDAPNATSSQIVLQANTTLTLDNGAFASGNFAPTITGFAGGDFIDLPGLAFNPNDQSAAFTNGTLSLQSGSTVDTLHMGGVSAGAAFAMISDGHGGSEVIQPLTASTEGQLNSAIQSLDIGGSDQAQGGTNYAIALTGNIDLTSDLDAINLGGGTLTIDGNGHTIDGLGDQRGFFVYNGTVSINDMTIQNAVAVGGAGGVGGGGGGAGLGGGLFVAGTTGASSQGNGGGHVTLDNVSFVNDSAVGGAGGTIGPHNGAAGGGGGGLGGDGGAAWAVNGGFGSQYGGSGGGGGGGVGLGADGGVETDNEADNDEGGSGAAGILLGAGPGGAGYYPGASYNTSGGAAGGGGGALFGLAGGGGVDGEPGAFYGVGGGGFGGGGAGGNNGTNGGGGGFGGGGGGGDFHRYNSQGSGGGGGGGFGGGGGESPYGGPGGGGFGGGAGGHSGGGGGLGAGGDVFVQQGGSLTIEGGSLSGGTAVKGTGAGDGSDGAAYGDGIFLVGNEAITFAPVAGQTLTLDDPIADMTGSNDPSGWQGNGSVVIGGAGTVVLAADNTYTGGTTIDSGTLDLAATNAVGSGGITFNGTASLDLSAAALPADGSFAATPITGFAPLDQLDLQGLGFVQGATTASFTAGALTVSNGTATDTLSLPDLASGSFVAAADGHGGTLVAITQPLGLTGTFADTSTIGATPTLQPLSAVAITDPNAGQLETATVTLTNPAAGTLSLAAGYTGGVALNEAGAGVYTLGAASASAEAAAIDALRFSPGLPVAPGGATVGFDLEVTDTAGQSAGMDSASYTIDPGPTINPATPGTVEVGQTTVVGTVAPGLAGDTLTLNQTGGAGTVALQQAVGVDDIVYTAPATITSSTVDPAAYTITDQYGDGAAGSAGVTLDAGPSITSVTPSPVSAGRSTEIGVASPGLPGDTLTLSQAAGIGTVSLQQVGGAEEIIYTAPASLAGSTEDSVSYSIADQHQDAVASGSASIQLDAATPSEIVGGPYSGNENSAISLGALAVSTSPPTSDTLSSILSVAHGTIAVGTGGGATITGNGTGAVTVTGNATEVDAALSAAKYTGTANFYGTDTLSMTTTDTVDGKSTGAQTASIAVADTATIGETAPAALDGVWGSPLPLTGISVSDTPNAGDTLTTVLKVSHGTIMVATPGAAGLKGNGTSAVTLTGTAAAINAALASADYDAASASGTDTLSITTTDPTGRSSGTRTVAIAANAPSAPDLGLGLGAGSAGALNETNLSNPLFGGTSQPIGVVLLYDNGNLDGGGIANGQGQWAAAPLLPLAAGTQSITASALTLAGFSAISAPATITEIKGTTFSGAGANQNVNFQAGGGNNTMQWSNGIGVAIAGNGNNTVTAGNGADVVQLGNGSNTVTLGSGNDRITTGNGHNVIALGNGTDTIGLGSGANTLMLGSGNDRITTGNGHNVIALGNGTDTIGLGSGANTLTLGDGNYTVTTPGNGGHNELILTAPSAGLTMAFQSQDELVFANVGFDLAIDDGKGTGTPQAISSSLFSTSNNGTFTSTDQRFAYNQATGNLYYDAQGNKAGSTSELVAHLTNDPHLTAANLYFIT